MAVPTSTDASANPKSTHVSDPTLQPFLQPTFDPADYLNATLPSLALSSTSSRAVKHGQAVSLADLSSQTQDLISQLNAHTTRLSTILTQLTDDILRSGGRLAYEVEVLRGDTVGLTETLTEGLKGDVEKFLPGGISLQPISPIETEEQNPNTTSPAAAPATTATDTQSQKKTQTETTQATPSDISTLHTLHKIRTRLETVISTFGEAMKWTLPPSELSLSSSLISVSGPDPNADLEKRGKEFATAVRSEISDLILGSGEGGGAEAAATRIQALRDLAQVWKGTAEEKARVRFVESLVKLAEEKQNALAQQQQQQQNRQRAGRSGSASGSAQNRGATSAQAQAPAQQQKSGGGGFLDNLARIRENISFE
jgi:hypothetical protein